jgi:signal transduction histidine kinase
MPNQADEGSVFTRLGEDSAWTARLLLRALESYSVRGYADWTRLAAAQVYRLSQATARAARSLAQQCQVSAERAEIAGLLSPLGALAWHGQPAPIPGRSLPNALDQLTRALARRYQIPQWLRGLLLGVGLPADPHGGDDQDIRLLLVVQAALGLAQRHHGLKYPRATHAPEDALARLEVPASGLEWMTDLLQEQVEPPGALATAGPALAAKLLHALLPARGDDSHQLASLETEAERLRGLLTRLQASEVERLRDMKLRSLAEMAAGAGHEINNPLAVILGQAQHLLRSEECLDRVRALERIVAQSRRIHELLKDLMLYARPPKPRLRIINLGRLVHDAVTGLTELALERGVHLDYAVPRRRCDVRADRNLLALAIACLVRNALEAAPVQGAARVYLKTESNGRVEVIVEDNGPGLAAAHREHLFDPFYSGRSAGRGSGLGLSKAWRIAQLHGGALDFQSEPGKPTRFVLSLPLAAGSLPRRAASSPKALSKSQNNGKHARARKA